MSKKNEPPTFEKALSELETLVSKIESGQLPLEESIAAYTRGTTLLKQCQETLTNAEQQVLMLNQSNKLEAHNASDD